MSTHHFTSAELLSQRAVPSHDPTPRVEPFAYSAAGDRTNWVLLGESSAVRQLRSQIRRVAPYFRIALIRGESGSGKELVARAIHSLSSGAKGPFIVADAAALAESLDPSGEPCARSSATQALESAQGGTLYLTPIGGLSFGHQAALLHFLRACEERRGSGTRGSELCDTSRPYGRHPITRILAASNDDLRTLATIGQFRQDLYARLSAVEIFIPPLRQRVEDIPVLVDFLLQKLTKVSGQSGKLLTETTLSRLQAHPWPDNLRELDRVITQAAALAKGGVIELRHLVTLVEPGGLPPSPSSSPSAMPVERLHDVMLRHVFEVLTLCGGNKVRAANLLGISRSTLYRMLDSKSASGRPLAE